MISIPDHSIHQISHAYTQAVRWGVRLAGCLFAMFLHRPFRVLVLSLAIVAMSAADLYLTLLFVTRVGMNEMNPLARAMMEYQSPAILAAWKTATVVLSVGILIMIRKQRSAELGAWIGCLVMGWLMLHWTGFINMSGKIDIELAQSDENPNWIMISTQVQGREGVGSWVVD